MVSLTLIGVLGALWAAFAILTGLDDDTSHWSDCSTEP
jgi:hypothetical protein